MQKIQAHYRLVGGGRLKKTITPIQMKPKVKETPQEHGKKRVAAYTRVSTEQDEQLNSLSVQQRYFEELIKTRSG